MQEFIISQTNTYGTMDKCSRYKAVHISGCPLRGVYHCNQFFIHYELSQSKMVGPALLGFYSVAITVLGQHDVLNISSYGM